MSIQVVASRCCMTIIRPGAECFKFRFFCKAIVSSIWSRNFTWVSSVLLLHKSWNWNQSARSTRNSSFGTPGFDGNGAARSGDSSLLAVLTNHPKMDPRCTKRTHHVSKDDTFGQFGLKMFQQASWKAYFPSVLCLDYPLAAPCQVLAHRKMGRWRWDCSGFHGFPKRMIL